MSDKKIKVAIAHPHLGSGGSEASVMWGIEALKDEYDTSLITTSGVDLDELNRYYGTSIRLDDFRIRKVTIPFFLKRMVGGDALKGALYQRYCQKIATDYDVLISAYNLCDFGVPGIHYIQDFSWNEDIRKRMDPIPHGLRKLFHRNNMLKKAYLSLVKLMSKRSGRNLFAGEDTILAISDWSAKTMSKMYGADFDVIYPPVLDEFPKVSLKDKEMGFVCIGRISSEKRIEQIIEILKTVRQQGHNISLHIIGSTKGTPYGRFIENLCQSEGDWVVMEGKQFGEDKSKLLSKYRFGIHARQGEAFGISVAEMVKAGCITFVPNEGGPVEIVNHSALTYNSIEDAVDKIDAVLRQPELQTDLRNHLVSQGKKFTISRFMKGLQKAVEEFLVRRQ